jgi:hypothetical protein
MSNWNGDGLDGLRGRSATHKTKTSRAPEEGAGGHLHSVALWIVGITMGSLALGSAAGLLVWDAVPQAFPARAHVLLGSAPLALIAVASLVYQAARRPSRLEMVKAVILATAFLFWAANQLLPDVAPATLFNDLAIALFVLDVFLLILGWPPSVGHLALPEAPSTARETWPRAEQTAQKPPTDPAAAYHGEE